jgi:hypothetical protein
VGPRRRIDHLGRRRRRHVGGVLLIPARASRARPGYWSMRFMLIHDTVHARLPGQRP